MGESRNRFQFAGRGSNTISTERAEPCRMRAASASKMAGCNAEVKGPPWFVCLLARNKPQLKPQT
jgi:hypothetical protein